MKIKDALSKFYVKLGGSPTDINADDTSGDILEKISDVYTDKEGTHVEVTTPVTEGTKIATVKTNNEDHDIYAPTELPSVTSSDEGKVLTVDSNGAWGAATPSAGGSGFSIINCTVTQDPDTELYYLNLPSGVIPQDIRDRFASGEFIILSNAGTNFYYPLNSEGDSFATMVGSNGETIYASVNDNYYDLTFMTVDISSQ